MRESKTIAESITGISYEEIKSLANNEAKSKFLGDQLRLTYIDGYKAGFDKGAEEMAKIKDAQIEGLVEALELANNELLTIDDHINYRKMERYYAVERSKNINLVIYKIQKAIENFRSAAEDSETFHKEGSNDPEVK